MFNLKRFLSKLLRVYYKLDRDKRNFHDLFYEKSKIKKNFIFNIKKIKKK